MIFVEKLKKDLQKKLTNKMAACLMLDFTSLSLLQFSQSTLFCKDHLYKTFYYYEMKALVTGSGIGDGDATQHVTPLKSFMILCTFIEGPNFCWWIVAINTRFTFSILLIQQLFKQHC